MLDQNTDRMWYVIGAVLVGAAIILIANGTLPQMFASVTESFDNVTSETIGGVGEIVGSESVYSRLSYKASGTPGGFGWSIGGRESSVVANNIKVEPDTWYTVTYEKVGEASDLTLLLLEDATSRTWHNQIYSDPLRTRQLYTTTQHYRKNVSEGNNITVFEYLTGPVTYTFKTNEDENYLTMTSSNMAPIKNEYDNFSFEYRNIELNKLF